MPEVIISSCVPSGPARVTFWGGPVDFGVRFFQAEYGDLPIPKSEQRMEESYGGIADNTLARADNEFQLEDFEDGQFNLPGLQVRDQGPITASPLAPSANTRSIEPEGYSFGPLFEFVAPVQPCQSGVPVVRPGSAAIVSSDRHNRLHGTAAPRHRR